MPVDERHPSIVKRLETRVIVCSIAGEKYGLTYRWNEQGTDAVLISDSEEEIFNVTDASGNSQQRKWSYPSRSNCMECHTAATGQSLGLRTHQTNRWVTSPSGGAPVNQLAYFNQQSMFSGTLTSEALIASLAARAPDDLSAPLEHRVRSYLDANCAHCHQPGVVPSFDARLQTPLRNQGLVNGLIKGHFALPGGCYIRPGDPSLSAVHVRAASTEPGISMPPLGKHVADPQGISLLTEYIESLTDEEFAVDPLPMARYIRLDVPYNTNVALGEFRVLDNRGFAIPHSELLIAQVSSETEGGNAILAIDGDPMSSWISTAGFPHFITVDLMSVRSFGGFEFVPRQDEPTGGFGTYQVSYSSDLQQWTNLTSTTNQPNFTAPVRYDLFESKRPVRAAVAGPTHSFAAEFPVTVVFDTLVTDFSSADLQVSGGTVKSISGSGYYYTAIIKGSASEVGVRVAAGTLGGTYGNRVSNTWTVTSDLATPPVPVVVNTPPFVSGPFELRYSFDKPFTGLDRSDFVVSSGKLEWLIPEEGNTCRLIISPDSDSSFVYVYINDGAVTGINGLVMDKGFRVMLPFRALRLEAEGEEMSGSGIPKAGDPAASGAFYIGMPEGSRGFIDAPSDSLTRSRTMNLPFADDYFVRGWTRADDATSDSFHLRVYYGSTASPWLPWITNQGPGEIGSQAYHEGFARGVGGEPHFFPRNAGWVYLHVSAAEDGTRLDRIEMVPKHPFATWSVLPVGSSEGLKAKLRFTSAVTGLEPDDFEAIDGEVTSIAGSGRDYVVTLRPFVDKMVLRVKENAVTDETGVAGVASPLYVAAWSDGNYADWATSRGLSALPEDDDRDPDGDGVGQIMEYALGLDPLRSDTRTVNSGDAASRGLPRLEFESFSGGKRLVLIYRCRSDGTPLKYTAEFGDDMDSLVPSTNGGQAVAIDPKWREVRVSDEASMGSDPRRFGRLKVTR